MYRNNSPYNPLYLMKNGSVCQKRGPACAVHIEAVLRIITGLEGFSIRRFVTLNTNEKIIMEIKLFKTFIS
jgi:hypothetical protein